MAQVTNTRTVQYGRFECVIGSPVREHNVGGTCEHASTTEFANETKSPSTEVEDGKKICSVNIPNALAEAVMRNNVILADFYFEMLGYQEGMKTLRQGNWILLKSACHLGYLDIVEWVSNKDPGTDVFVGVPTDSPLNDAWLNGQHAIAELICDLRAITYDDVRAYVKDTFKTVCAKGWDEIATRMAARFKELSRTKGFRIACKNGYVDLAQNLVSGKIVLERFDLIEAFHDACEKGHLPVAKWLHATYTIQDSELQLRGRRGIHVACMNVHTSPKYAHLIAWLVETFGLNDEDFDNDAVISSLAEHPSLVAWMCRKNGIFHEVFKTVTVFSR